MKKHFFTKRNAVLPIIAIIFLIVVSFSLYFYRNSLEENLQSTNCSAMSYVLDQQRFTFRSKLLDLKSSLESYADSFVYEPDISEKELLKRLNTFSKNSSFEYASYADIEGNLVENTGSHTNVFERDYFQKALKGETVISNPIMSQVIDLELVAFATPIYDNDKVAAILIGGYGTKSLANLLPPAFNEKGYAYITANDGKIILKTKTDGTPDLNSNLLDIMKSTEVIDFDGEQAIKENIRIGDGGHTRYVFEHEKRFMHYAPVGINDWYMFSIVPESAINSQSVDIMNSASIFMLMVVILSIVLLIYLFIMQSTHMSTLTQIAFVDALTGVANKKKFTIDATKLLESNPRQYAFVILDIDMFKVINDTLGYDSGDALLITIAKILKQRLNDKELLGRCDSDEYFLLIEYVDDQTTRTRLYSIIAQIENSFKAQVNDSYSLVLCAGVYVIANPKEPVNTISDRARHAHRLVKGMDESGISFYNEEMRNRILDEKEIENKMHDALKKEEFLFYLQPKYYLKNEKIYGAEALVRWKRDDIIISPDNFIPLFEKNGFITKLDMYMLEKACQTIRGWIDDGIAPIAISINFSRIHLKNPSFVNDIAAIVEKYKIPPEFIEIELTESAMLDNEDVLIAMLEHLHEHGFTLSMDDFGSGYSSLGLLKNLPVDVIKLDRTFFVDFCEISRAVTVVGSIISMAKNLGIKTVAEGVETKAQIDFLKKLGCDIVQGYYFAKPMTVPELAKLLY